MEKWSLITSEETYKTKRGTPEIPARLVLEQAKPAAHVPGVVPLNTCEKSSSWSVSQQLLLLIYDHTPDSMETPEQCPIHVAQG